MANHRSAEKAARKARRQQLRNRSVKSAVRTQIKKAEALINGRQLIEAEGAVMQAMRALDKASQKGVLHANNVARRKSRLSRKLVSAKANASAN